MSRCDGFNFLWRVGSCILARTPQSAFPGTLEGLWRVSVGATFLLAVVVDILCLWEFFLKVSTTYSLTWSVIFGHHGATVSSCVSLNSLLCGHQTQSHPADLLPSNGNEPCLFLNTQIPKLLFSPESAAGCHATHSETIACPI